MLNQSLGECGMLIKTLVAALAGAVTFLWGRPDHWFYALLALIALDYVSGVIAAIIGKTLSSKIGLTGILKKIMLLLVVALAHILDSVMGMDGAVRNMVVGFFAANEGISLLENCARAGVSFPKKLMELLTQFNDKNDG